MFLPALLQDGDVKGGGLLTSGSWSIQFHQSPSIALVEFQSTLEIRCSALLGSHVVHKMHLGIEGGVDILQGQNIFSRSHGLMVIGDIWFT
jgi:hypothetical protein